MQGNTYNKTAGLHGAGTVDVKIYVPNMFEITPAERDLLFAIVDAMEKFELHCMVEAEKAR